MLKLRNGKPILEVGTAPVNNNGGMIESTFVTVKVNFTKRKKIPIVVANFVRSSDSQTQYVGNGTLNIDEITNDSATFVFKNSQKFGLKGTVNYIVFGE